MPKKTFAAGELLTSTDVNSFLMNQSVMTFASSAARTTAIPTPTEGMTTYLQDTDELQFYNGSSWFTAVVTNDDDTITTTGSFSSTSGKVIANRSSATGGSVAGGMDFRIDNSTWGQIFMNSTSEMRFTATRNQMNRINLSAQPYFVAGNASGSSGSTVVKVTWNTVYNGYDFSSSQYNVPTTGTYAFSAQVRIDGASAGGYMRLAIVRNNGTVYSPPNLHAIFGSAHSTDYQSMAVSGAMYCVAGDNVSVWAGREGGGSSFQGESTFTGWLLG